MDQTLALSPEQSASRPAAVCRADAAALSGDDQVVTLAVENMHCGGCMQTVETALKSVSGVRAARVNLSNRRVVVRAGPETETEHLISALKDKGFQAFELNLAVDDTLSSRTEDLTRRLGVVAFATMNIMLLSVSVWSGGEGDMSEPVRHLFHWLSALIALPAIAYSGQPFFSSAWRAVAARRVNMDVPISLGVILTASLSLYQTYHGSERIYFDAAVMLLTFLLLGRLLDQLMRRRAANAAENLLKLRQVSVRVVSENGRIDRRPVKDVVSGMRLLVPSGERFAIDGRIVSGSGTIDQSAITGESLPQAAGAGAEVLAGSVNLGPPLVMEATRREDQSLLCEITELLQAAQQERGRYVVISDRAARLYAPLVHTLAALTFIGWIVAGAGWEVALPIAVAVLIITCPCALALAVPAVQVAAAGRLMRKGIILKSPDALERIAECDIVVFDKTGTLTVGEPRLGNSSGLTDVLLASAAGLAANSTHPYSKAIVRAAEESGMQVVATSDVSEEPGFGLTAMAGDKALRLGSAEFCGLKEKQRPEASVYFQTGNEEPVGLLFEDAVKADSATVVAQLQAQGMAVTLLSGDTGQKTREVAERLGIRIWSAHQKPADKVAFLNELKEKGRKVLMVGDGLNDAPSLGAAHASMSLSSASHVSQNAADVVFQGEKLAPVLEALKVSRRAQRLVMQNFGLAIGYNALFIPLAVLGLVTPLIAAIAMSVSSISVTANALRVGPANLGATT